MKCDNLILYRDDENRSLLKEICSLFKDGKKEDAFRTANRLLTLSDDLGFEGNLWHDHLAWYIANNENSFSTACEMRKDVSGTLPEIALHDMEIFRELISKDIAVLDEKYGTDCFSMLKDYRPCDENGKTFNRRIRDSICDLAVKLADAADAKEMLSRVCDFYGRYGVGKFGLNKAFRIYENDSNGMDILPIKKIAHVSLSDLVGYEEAKQRLRDNTEAFVSGRCANNCLIYGDAGTGKSSAVKGIMNEYYDKGLRLIEVYRHQFKYLNDVVAAIKDRNYRFIIYMDDLSFEDNETEYKYLKALIEGGLERKPDNILIYATSNRRHLIHENFADKLDRRETDDIHESDTVEEKLSLYNRFGVTIYFGRPSPMQFKEIVLALAKRAELKMSDEELLYEANKWELRAGGLSGRTARQFIDYISGTVEK
ncbi:MAG: ATP-binding protein [Lachnospiraceae bacterium]|nr:ATP-binding protein [Lachnospiraceae bacterium]